MTRDSKQSFDSSYSEKSKTTTSSSSYTTSRAPEPPAPSRRNYSQPRNGYTTCGRHTDQFLFGGPSFGDIARSILGRTKEEEQVERGRR